MLGTITEIEVRVGSKVSVNYSSHELSIGMKVMVPPEADPNEVAEGCEAFGNAFVGRGQKEWMDAQAPAVVTGPNKPEALSEDSGLGPKPEAKPETKNEGEEVSFKCAKFTLAKLPDKKFKLELYPEIKGEPGKYPTVRYTAERDAMWGMLEDVADGFDFSDLPVEYKVEWLVHYVIGREFVISSGEHKGEKSHYKDLVAIKGM